MSAYNQVTLLGNLKDKPIARKVGKRIQATFILNVERPYEIDAVNIVVWDELAEVCANYLKAGRKALIDGRIQIRTYNQDGERKWITEIVADNIKFFTRNATVQ